jgi:hypothetical protein
VDLTKCCVSVASLILTVTLTFNTFIAGKTDAEIDKNSIERDKYSGRRCPGPQVGGLAHRFVMRIFIFRYIIFQREIRCV